VFSKYLYYIHANYHSYVYYIIFILKFLIPSYVNMKLTNKYVHSGAVVSIVAEVVDPLCAEFACSPRVSVGSLRALRLPPTVQRHADWGLG
ncbi:hypothetical protein P3382_26825, partial [Vibrio parahaemolyticus]|nr:hypothetical protein [Vibrio parahaemolyticus]